MSAIGPTPNRSPEGEPLERHRRRLLDRRRFLGDASCGLASIALGSLLAPSRPRASLADSPLAPRAPHFVPRARRVVMIFCSGALSHVDTWDHKPELEKRDGQPLPGAASLITFQGENGNLTRSPWAFRPRGRCGKQVSDLLPHLAELVDEMCFIHSMTSRTNTHGPGETFMNTGFLAEGFPSAGAWAGYALGNEAQDLPVFVAIPDPRGVPQTGAAAWSHGFLPAAFQGTPIRADRPVLHLARPADIDEATDRATAAFRRRLDEEQLARFPGDAELAARIASYELAARMQLSIPELADLSRESAATRARYGADDQDPVRAGFARNCLLARRLCERGVRFVQLFNGSYAMGEGVGNWDGHKSLAAQYAVHAPILDRPAAALLMDLKARGLLADTLVVFTTEFGRMPTFQKGASGRDHNPHGFTVWLAGAGVKAPFSFGATDEFGHRAVSDVATVYDLHATILHLLGLDHERLTFDHDGVRRRLTDVHGHVLHELLA
ncbi:MAG: DUF1501 domain-containing protein [Planctomycetes bacterium]|nr:DUF1501 domain-containing protein [Planctomycetota bacterium]